MLSLYAVLSCPLNCSLSHSAPLAGIFPTAQAETEGRTGGGTWGGAGGGARSEWEGGGGAVTEAEAHGHTGEARQRASLMGTNGDSKTAGERDTGTFSHHPSAY